VVRIEQAQRQLNAALSRNLRVVGREGSPAAALTVLGLAFLYGALHAAGPGHGKLVLASFLLGREARWLRGVATGFALSLAQIISSTAVVAVLALLLGYTGFEVTARATWVEVVSYGLVAVVGLVLFTRALRGGRHAHDHAAEPVAVPGGVVLAAGLTPCPSGIVVLLFALANGVFVFGILANLVMAVGMGLTLAMVGLVTISARQAALRPLATRSPLLGWARRGLAITGSLALVAVGTLFFLAAIARLA
jgi:ABC-type nickel/cobalt efflux system permease component RcnA